MELRRSGSNLAQVLKTVWWNSANFRAFLSFFENEAANIRLILMDREGVSSEKEDLDQVEDAPSPLKDTDSS